MNASPLLALFCSRGHELKREGRSYKTCCPFHPDDTPSLSITPEKGLWRCFGCGAGGDGITFLQKADALSFGEAADVWRELTGEEPKFPLVGVSPTPSGSSASSKDRVQRMKERGRSQSAMGAENGKAAIEAATIKTKARASLEKTGLELERERVEMFGRLQQLYARDLAKSKKALEYLKSRGITDMETIRAFGLGYVTGKGLPQLSEEQARRLQDLGILNEKGNETFYGCIVCPLYDSEGRVVDFWGRSCRQRVESCEQHPKGARGSVHRCCARPVGKESLPQAVVPQAVAPHAVEAVVNYPALRSGERVVLVEGFLDALACYQGGIRNAIPLGSSCGRQGLVELLSREGISEVWVATDPDEAGDEGAKKLGAALERRGIASFRVRLDYDPCDFFANGGTAQVFRETAARGEILGRGSDESEFLLDSNGLLYRARLCTPGGPDGQRDRGKLKAQVLVSCGRQDGVSAQDSSRRPQGHRDVLNLYVHKTRKAFCNAVVKEFEDLLPNLPCAAVEADLKQIIEGLEQREIQKSCGRQVKQDEIVMSPEEQEEARAYLTESDLVTRLLEDMEALGYVGEEEAKLLVYLIGTSRKLPKPLSGIIQSGSGAGKSFLAGLVEQLMPPEDVIMLSRLSPQALFYMPSDFAVRKILMLEERMGGEAADYAIRSLQSKDELTQLITMKDPATGQMSTQMFKVLGPIAFLETTTENYLNPENTSRCFEIPLDESAEQTRRIHEHQRRARALGGLKQRVSKRTICKTHHNIQRVLRPVQVVIPFAEAIEFPARYLRTRRDHERFLSLIEASAFLHQFQRVLCTASIDGREVEYIEATVEDYALAYRLAQKVLWVSLDELSRWGRELVEWMQTETEELLRQGMVEGSISWTRREVRERLSWPDRRLREALEELVSLEHLEQTRGVPGNVFHYRLAQQMKQTKGRLLGLLSPEQLKEKLKRAKRPS